MKLSNNNRNFKISEKLFIRGIPLKEIVASNRMFCVYSLRIYGILKLKVKD